MKEIPMPEHASYLVQGNTLLLKVRGKSFYITKDSVLTLLNKKAITMMDIAEGQWFLLEESDKQKETICECKRPRRHVKQVEGKNGYVKDVYCQKCDRPIYP